MYDETIYLLDLCILSYQLHAQTLIWPMDPYYEQMINNEADPAAARRTRRNKFMDEVRVATKGNGNLHGLHGPGSCQGDSSSGWDSNELLEPVIADYARLNPWLPSFTRPRRAKEPWIVYNTPSAITDLIDVVKMVRYASNYGPYHLNPPQVDTIHRSRPALNRPNMPAAKDLLCCFEGGTGAISGAKTQQRYAAWSLMGFVFARTVTDVELKLTNANPQNPTTIGYDLYIVFRGSRSGELRPKEASYKEKGNPDWVTDLDFFALVPDLEISAQGSVCRGFRTSLKTMLPTVLGAINDIASLKQYQPPRGIYVTGHSLGAALACHFSSAMVCGTEYGPKGAGAAMPDLLKRWPWSSIQLVTFSSPVVGGKTFHDRFDRSIGTRRVWLDGDPVTCERRHYMVGVPYWVRIRNQDTLEHIDVGLKPSSHQPYLVRQNLVRSELRDKVDMTDVPAGTGKDDIYEPWKLWKHCDEMIYHLEFLALKQNFTVSALFPDFIRHFCSYLTIFQQCYPDLAPASNSAKSKALNDLIRNVRQLDTTGPVTLAKLAQYWGDASNIQADEDFSGFIGLCLFLANISKGFGSAPDTLTALIDRNTAYKALLTAKI
jgi:hypothetical protein